MKCLDKAKHRRGFIVKIRGSAELISWNPHASNNRLNNKRS